MGVATQECILAVILKDSKRGIVNCLSFSRANRGVYETLNFSDTLCQYGIDFVLIGAQFMLYGAFEWAEEDTIIMEASIHF